MDKRKLWKMGDFMEILAVGGRLYVPPEDEARVLVPQLLQVLEPNYKPEEGSGEIGGASGGDLEERQVISRDNTKALAQCGEGSEGSIRRGGAGGAPGDAATDRKNFHGTAGSLYLRALRESGSPHPELS